MKKQRFPLLPALLAVLALTLAACQSAVPPAEPTATQAPAVEETSAPAPSVTAADQAVTDGMVTIDEAVSNGAGWVVIHAQADGKPGPILGYAPLADGVNRNVTVEIDAAGATETLYAMLHTDTGEAGVFEFPNGADAPVQADGKVAVAPFAVSVMSAGAQVEAAQDAALGTFLTDAEGMTLYVFLNDAPGQSNCYDTCAQNWPPLLTDGAPTAGEGVDAALLGTAERSDGAMQVTYNGWPLYYFAADAAPGDVKGQGVKDVWYVIAPDGGIIR